MDRGGAVRCHHRVRTLHFYNESIDATGVSDMSAASYEVSGNRLATYGYVPRDSPDR